jgi:hypothetical protein
LLRDMQASSTRSSRKSMNFFSQRLFSQLLAVVFRYPNFKTLR